MHNTDKHTHTITNFIELLQYSRKQNTRRVGRRWRLTHRCSLLPVFVDAAQETLGNGLHVHPCCAVTSNYPAVFSALHNTTGPYTINVTTDTH